MLPTWRAKGLCGPRSSIPALRQLRLLKVWQFCGETDKRVSEVTPLPGTRGPRAPPSQAERGGCLAGDDHPHPGLSTVQTRKGAAGHS